VTGDERRHVTAARVRGVGSLRDALALGDAGWVQPPAVAHFLLGRRARMDPVDGVRDALVLRLRAQIERGEYRPDYQAVADKLLRDVYAHVACCATGR